MSSPELAVFQNSASDIADAASGLLSPFALKLYSKDIIDSKLRDNVTGMTGLGPDQKANLLVKGIEDKLKHAKSDKDRKELFELILKVMDDSIPLDSVAEKMREEYPEVVVESEKREQLYDVMLDMSHSLPRYIVDHYIRLLAISNVKCDMKPDWLLSKKFLELYSTHVSEKSPQVAASYVYKILTGLGYEEMEDFRAYLHTEVEIDTKITEELEKITEFRPAVIKVIRGELGPRLGDYQIGRYRMVLTVLCITTFDSNKSFLELFTDLTGNLGKYPLAVSLTIGVLERSGWGDTKKLKLFSLPNFDINTSYPKIDLCLTVADYYGNMRDRDFSSAKVYTSVVHLKSHNVSNMSRVQFTLLLMERGVIEVGDVSKIEDKVRYPIFFKEYKKRCERLSKDTAQTVMPTKETGETIQTQKIVVAQGTLILTIVNLSDVIRWLQDAGFNKTRWRELGGTLGLHPNTLNMIRANERGDTDDCFRECLSKWLRRSDDVDEVVKPSLDVLADALDKMDDCAAQAEYMYIRYLFKKEIDSATTKTGAGNKDAVNVNEWLKEGRVDLTVKRVQMLGLPGSGKTCSQRLLLNEDPPKEDNSTSIACRAVKATRISSHDDCMERIDAEALLSSLAHDLKEAPAKQNEPPPEKDHSTESKEESLEIKTTEADLVAELAGSAEATESAADTTETAADDTEANKIINEIVKAIPNAKGKFDSHLVYIIDSGGQTAFQELLPLFTRPASLNIITLDLSKDIDEKVKQEYRINRKPFSCDSDDSSEVSYMTNIEFLKDVLSSGAILQPYHAPQPIGSKENTSTGSTTSPQYAEYFVLGTHKDKANPDVIKNYNDELKKLKSASEKEGYYIIRDGEIYPVNTMIKSPDREAEAKELCKIIYYNTGSGEESKVPIPVRWFAFELTLLEKAKGCSFLQMDDVLLAGNNLKMTDDQTKEALQFLHNVTIILYYPQVLPDVVFVDPHPILDILSCLLVLVVTKNHHPFVKEGVRPLPSELNNLKKNGLFTKALLEKLKDDEDFPKPDFIKLLLHLHIIVETDEQDKSNEKEYFIPSALPPRPKTSQPPKLNIDPLQIIWRSSVTDPKFSPKILPVPRGIFSLAVIKLMKHSKSLQFRFPPPESPQYFRYRDAMSFHVYPQDNQVAHIGTIDIIKKHKHLEIYFEGDASKYCSLIRKAVKGAISSSCEVININPDGYEFAFACPSSKNGCYHIVTNEDKKEAGCILCRSSPNNSGKEKYWSWFDKKSLNKDPVDSPAINQGQLLNTSHLVDVLDILKKHRYCGVSYYDLGLHLGLLSHTLDVIKEENKGNVDSCLRECLKAWLQRKDNAKNKGGPTYDTLIQALRKMEENTVADGIQGESKDY